jgi:hypothetical protein
MIKSVAMGFRDKKEAFQNIKNAMCESELTFDLYYGTSVVNIVDKDGVVTRWGSIPDKKGMFLPQITNKVVNKRLKSGEYVPINTDSKRYTNNTIMYNAKNIKRNFKNLCVAVDITACYWQSAFNLGVIDEKTYNIGMSKDREYKIARNVSIGSIGAMIFHQKYENGKLVFSEITRRPGACARLDIIDHVWQVAQRIAGKLGKDFCMYLTDCFYAPATKTDDLCKYIEEEGYTWKLHQVGFQKIDRMSSGTDRANNEIYTEKVIWYDFEKKKDTFHDFSNKHNINF